MVHGLRTNPSHHGIANGIVHGVIESRRAIRPAHDPNGYEISAFFRQFRMRQKALGGKIGDELSGRPHEFLQ